MRNDIKNYRIYIDIKNNFHCNFLITLKNTLLFKTIYIYKLFIAIFELLHLKLYHSFYRNNLYK